MRYLALALSALLLALTPGASAQTASSTTTWTKWEASLTSSKSYTNPYTDVTVSVTYTGPSGQTFASNAFWDGGSTWRIRCAFPATGTWNWKTTCSDTTNSGLHNRTGSVSVASYSGTNPLYRRGFLKVSGSKRYLTYDDGTPFLWMGDTAWVAPLKASQSDWQAYVDDRAAKGFTVIQISPASSWGGSQDVNGNAPFIGSGLSMWNPPFWQGFDQKVQYANDKGIVVLLVGIMEPTFRYPSTADAQRFARNIAARLYGNHVVFSPSFDSTYMTLGDDVGSALKASTARHLITQHVGTSLSAAQSYYDKTYLDFCGEQSGHNGGDRELCAKHAITWTLALYGRNPYKPVINLEAFYDANGTTAGMEPKYLGTAKDARQLGYLSWLSGSLGYTYGAYGIWNWQTDSTKGYYWSKAMQYPSSTEMKHMAKLFASLAWWRLEPVHSLITNQPSTYLQRMVLAKTSAGDLAVAYMPDNASMTVSMSSFPTPMSAQWFSPTTGAYTAGPSLVPNSGSYTFSRPGSGDWVLVLKPASTTADAPPTITRASATPNSGTAPLTVNFSAEATDPEGQALTYSWDFQGDGTYDATGPTASYTYTAAGHYDPVVRVSDGVNAVTQQLTVDVDAGGGVAITNFTVTSGKAYVWDLLDVGALQYIDRSFTFSDVPASWVGLPYLRTANDDKLSGGSAFLSFGVDREVTVYVAHDDRISPKPSWMSGWADTGADLVSGAGTFSLFAKDFPAGTVTLGGNGASESSSSMYTVVVRPRSAGGTAPAVTIDFVSTGRPYSLSTAQAGALYYLDRSYTIRSLSSSLNGGKLIRTANDDKLVTASPHLKFTVSQPATVYVCYDARAAKFPTWLNDGTWTVTSEAFSVTDSPASPMRVLSKSVEAGPVSLGGNHTGGDTGARSNYVVIVK